MSETAAYDRGAASAHLSRAKELLIEALGQVNAVLAMDVSDKNVVRLQRAVWHIDNAFGEVDESYANL